MEKELVLELVQRSVSSLYTKEDVIKIINSIDIPQIRVYQLQKQKNVMLEQKPQEYVSLFDYLGHPAGTALGTQVYEAAKRCKEKTDTRIVSTRTYNGKVLLYRKAFLQEYFASKQA
jgi:hypothetical protein